VVGCSLPKDQRGLCELYGTGSTKHCFNDDAVPAHIFAAWALRRRSQNRINRWDGATYRRVLPFDDVPVEVAVGQARNKLGKWLRLNEPLDHDGVARATKNGESYARHAEIADLAFVTVQNWCVE
jgi:hypothetical protein